MTGRLFNGEHNLRVRSRKTILELEPGLDAGRADPGAAGQTEKNSVRAYVFRFALELGHCSTQSACLKRARSSRRLNPDEDLGRTRCGARRLGVPCDCPALEAAFRAASKAPPAWGRHSRDSRA